MKKITRFTLSLCLLFYSTAIFAEGNRFAGVTIKATHVAGKIHVLEVAGGNIGLSVGPDGVLIVDSQFAPLASKIEAALKRFGKGELRYVLNTHWHGDHTGGNAHFGGNADIMAHVNVRKRLQEAGKPAAALPGIVFDEGLSLHFNGEEIRVVHLDPGHIDGDSVVWFTKSKVVHMGDHFFVGRFPFVDLASGGSVDGYLKNVRRMLKELPEDYRIIPGHGPLATKEDLGAFEEMLVETTGIVRGGIEAGKTLNQIKAEGLPPKYKDWGGGFINADRWISIVYGDLASR